MMEIDLSKKDERFLQLAKAVAKTSTFETFKHGAVLTKGGKVISTACNKDKFSSFAKRFRNKDYGRATRHSEVSAVLNLPKSVTDGATMYVVRVNRDGEFRLSAPCEMCYHTLQFTGVKKVIYTAGEDEVKQIKL
jgi:deoxycytidylate deaminase